MHSPERAQLVLALDGLPVAGQFPARQPRARTLLGGKLVYGPNSFTIDCSIRDMSQDGAKITLSGKVSLPPEFFLIVAKRAVAYRATVAWSKFPARGLHFTETIPLNGALPDELKFLRQLWLELASRTGMQTE